MRGTWRLAVATSLFPAAAAALSCADYTIRDVYWDYEARAETYVPALGAFSELKLVEAIPTIYTSQEIVPGRTVYSARFEGFRPSRRAFDQPFSTDVTLVFPDYSYIGGGGDSASFAEQLPGVTGLVWLEKTGSGYQLSAELCANMIDTDPASIKPALNCLAGRWCPKPG